MGEDQRNGRGRVPVADNSNPTHNQEVRAAKAQVGMRLGIAFLDLTPEQGGRKELYLEADPVHPNVEGDKIIARRLFETMSKLAAP